MTKDHLGARASRPHKTWHDRGYLPHFDEAGTVQFLTFRLVDAVPAAMVTAWKTELKLSGGETADDPRCARLRGRIERFADQGHGACWLKDARVGEVVQDALLHFDGERYRLLAWVIMPNHVHAVIETLPGFPWTGLSTPGSRSPPSARIDCQVGLEPSGWETISTAMFAMRHISGR